MRYKDIECEICKKPFEESDDVVVCPVCGSPHHRACWMEKNLCANDGLHAEGFEWKFPEDKDPLKQLAEQKKAAHAPKAVFSFKNGESVIECPKCGTLNYGNDAFCMRCKAPLNGDDIQKESSSTPVKPSDEPQKNGSSNRYQVRDPRQLAYDNQRLFGGLEPNIMIDGIPVAEYSDYIGGRTPGSYIRRFASMERFGRKFSVNFSAFVFGPIWFFYRKMNKFGAMFLTVATLLAAISGVLMMTPSSVRFYKSVFDSAEDVYSGTITPEEYYEMLRNPDIDTDSDTSESTTVRVIVGEVIGFARFGLRVAMALLADGLYRRKIKNDVEESRKQCSDMDSYRQMLTQKGGTSAFGAVIGTAAWLVAAFIGELPSLIVVLLS